MALSSCVAAWAQFLAESVERNVGSTVVGKSEVLRSLNGDQHAKNSFVSALGTNEGVLAEANLVMGT